MEKTNETKDLETTKTAMEYVMYNIDKMTQKIKEKFEAMHYTVTIKNIFYGTEITIEKHSVMPVKLNIRIELRNGESEIVIGNYIGQKCTENYLQEIEDVLNRINSKVDTYVEFIKSIEDGLDTSQNYYLDTFINNDATLYIKNTANDRILVIKPIRPIYTDNKKYTEVIVSSLIPQCDYLMNIYIPAANISDTVNALLFFL